MVVVYKEELVIGLSHLGSLQILTEIRLYVSLQLSIITYYRYPPCGLLYQRPAEQA